MFWLPEDELPAGVGSEAFCAAHLAYLAFFLALTVCYAFFYRKLDADRRKSAATRTASAKASTSDLTTEPSAASM